MSEEHLSSRGESPVVNLTSGQANTTTVNPGTTTKLSEVTYPVDTTDSVDTEMKDVVQGEVKEGPGATVPQVAINRGMKPSERPSLQEQVTIIRGKSGRLFAPPSVGF